MKSKNLRIYRCVIMLLLAVTFTEATKVQGKFFAQFLFSNSNVSLKGPGKSKFEGNVSLDLENKGIIITASAGEQTEAMLRLVGEKVDTDTYLVDFRLMRSCDFPVQISKNKNNLSFSFSPKSLENRNKNDDYNVQVDISNYKNFIPDENYKTEEEIKSYLKKSCMNRKNVVSNLKKEFSSSVTEYRKQSKALRDLNKKIISEEQEVENLQTAISDIQAQIKDINNLQNSYQLQLKSISSITNGTKRIFTKENEKLTSLKSQIKELEKKILDNFFQIKNQEENMGKIKDGYTKIMEKSKDNENTIINYQKDLADVENLISNVKSSRLVVEFDLKNAKSQKESSENTVTELTKQIDNYEVQNRKSIEKMNNTIKEKQTIEDNINNEKEEIKQLESEINQLILKKSQKEEKLKNKYDDVKVKEDLISNLKIENDKYLTNIKRLSERKEKLQGSERAEILFKISHLEDELKKFDKDQSQLESKKKKVVKNLKEQNLKKETINNEVDKTNKQIENTNKEIISLNRIRIDLDKRKAEISVELKDKEGKLKNLKNESQNYDSDVENVRKSLRTADENLQTFKGILGDFESKLTPIQASFKSILEQKSVHESKMKEQKQRIKSFAGTLKVHAPSATVMIDLAEDESFNDTAEEKGSKSKWRTLIDKIIS